MSWMAAAVVGGAVVGGYMTSQAAKSAAKTQANAANNATAAQQQALQQQLAVSAPYSQAGLTSQNRLMSLLGLQTPNFGPGNPWNEAAYLAANPDVAAAVKSGEFGSGLEHYEANGRNEGRNLGFTPAQSADFGKYATAEFKGVPGFDPNTLLQTFQGVKGFDPASLMQNFSTKDFQQDPGYAFRLKEGLNAMNATAAARGGLISGNALKAGQTLGQEMGSQEYQNAFNRYQANRAMQGQEYANAFNRFLAGKQLQGQEYGNAFNRFQTERGNTLNPLQTLTGQGQAAAAGQAANIGNFGAQQAANITGAGNATAAGQIGSANAYANAIGQAVGGIQTNQLLNRYAPQNTNTSAYTSNAGYGLNAADNWLTRQSNQASPDFVGPAY